jgi:hypothetical protein
MNVIVVAMVVAFIGNSPQNNMPRFEVVSYQDMTAEECITQANEINQNPDLPYTMVCTPKIIKPETK